MPRRSVTTRDTGTAIMAAMAITATRPSRSMAIGGPSRAVIMARGRGPRPRTPAGSSVPGLGGRLGSCGVADLRGPAGWSEPAAGGSCRRRSASSGPGRPPIGTRTDPRTDSRAAATDGDARSESDERIDALEAKLDALVDEMKSLRDSLREFASLGYGKSSTPGPRTVIRSEGRA